MKPTDNFNRPRFTPRQRVNKSIRYQYSQVRVIDENEEMIGLMDSAEALAMAQERGLDLVEISSNVTPPVCKILDYGKYKYKNQKQANLNKKNQKNMSLKELKLHVNIGSGDYGVKLKKARELLEEGHKVKISLRLRGREMMHKDIAITLFKKMVQDLEDAAKLERDIMQNNNQFHMMLIPNVKK